MTLSLISQPPELGISHNPSFWRLQSDEAGSDNLRVDAKVILDGTTIGTDSIPVDSGYISTFELSEYFKTLFTPAFTFPDVAMPPIPHQVATGNYKHVDLIFEEFCGSPPIETNQLDIQEYSVIYGRIPAYLHTWFYRSYNSFLDYLIATKNFLTFWPSTHYIVKAQTEKLFFCNTWYNAGDTLKVYITLHFVSGNRVTRELIGDPTAAMSRPYQVWEFHVGYNALRLTAFMKSNYPDEEIESYDIEIGTASNAIKSASHSYILDNKHYPKRREFIFRNSLGGYDTFIATGQASQSSEYEPEIIQVLPYWGVSGNARRTIRTTWDETVECNSGFLTDDKLAAMPQFFESDDVYEIIAGQLYPVGFPKQTVLRKTDKHGMKYIQFSYAYLPIHKIETNGS